MNKQVFFKFMLDALKIIILKEQQWMQGGQLCRDEGAWIKKVTLEKKEGADSRYFSC